MLSADKRAIGGPANDLRTQFHLPQEPAQGERIGTHVREPTDSKADGYYIVITCPVEEDRRVKRVVVITYDMH